jgi:hypothetical protein
MYKRARCFSFSFVLSIWLLSGAFPAHAQELSREAKIERILDLMNSQTGVDQILDQFSATINTQLKSQSPNAIPEQLAQAQEFQGKLMELVKSRVSWEKMRPEFVRIYRETYSDEEIDGMLAFYESPAGRGFVKKSPLLTQKIMAVTQTQLRELMPDIQRLARESLQKKP